jgi:hypothetical protein
MIPFKGPGCFRHDLGILQSSTSNGIIIHPFPRAPSQWPGDLGSSLFFDHGRQRQPPELLQSVIKRASANAG